ncbi:MAG: SMP-30/gluconolactonase/LRE family protein [Aggregatilineales bacterium]
MQFHRLQIIIILFLMSFVLYQPSGVGLTQSDEVPLTFESDRILADAFVLSSETPVITRESGNRYLNGGAVIFHEGQFHLFSNFFNNWPGETLTYYYTSTDGMTWNRAQEEPLFTIDDVPLQGRGALVLSGFVEADGTWVLYYHTFTSGSSQGFIGRATASSPTGDWVFDDTPALSPGGEGEWDDLQVMRVNVIPTDDGYVMYYAGVNAEGSQIGMARSEDGINWEKYDDPATTEAPYAESDPILSPVVEWEENWLGRPEVVLTEDGWVMLYEGGPRGSKTGIAISEDGVNFYRYAQNPMLTTSNMVNEYSFFQGAFFHHMDRYYYLIEAGNGRVGTDIFLYTLDGAIAPIFTASSAAEDTHADVVVADRDNLGNGGDLSIQFEAESIDHELRIFVITPDQDFPLSVALETPHYMTITPSSAMVDVMFSAEIADSNGDVIQEGVPYQVVVLDVENEVLSTPSNTIELLNVGRVFTVLPEIPAAAGGLETDHDGNLYFADFGEGTEAVGNAVYRVTTGGEVEVFFESDALAKGTGNAFDSEGNFYQSGYQSDTVMRVSPTGEVDVFVEDLNGPVGIVIDEENTLYVNNCDNGTIQRITSDGEMSQLVRSSLLSCPNGITRDEAGNLYVSNFRNSAIIRVTPSGEATQLARLPGSNNAHILYHNGILYAVSRGTHRLFTVSLDGEVEQFAGTGERGNQDGALLDATFTLPNDLSLSPDGRILYVNEVVADTDGINYPGVIRAILLPRDA